MSVATAIGSVSRSLRTLLRDRMELSTDPAVTLLAPDETASAPRVNLFLYQVAQHAQLRNAGPRLRAGTTDVLEGPPLSLVLSYLMTAYANNDPGTGNAEAHAILGEAMRVFHEWPVVPDDVLDEDLDDATERLQIVQVPLDPEAISRVWATFDAPYRLSVAYEVSVVQLNRSPASERPLARRVRAIGTPRVLAPYAPPRLLDLSPRSGTAGSTLTFSGEHLAGWRASVTVSGVEALAGEPLTGDTFTAPVPASLVPGFHEVRVDVAGLARATWFLEVV